MSVTPPNKQIAKPTNRPGKFWLIIILVVCIGVIIAIAVGKNKNQSENSGFTAYNYSTLVDSKVIGSRTSIEFQRPKEFSPSVKNSSILQSTYVHKGQDNQGSSAIIGDITGFAPHYILDENPTIDLSAVRNSFNTASDYQNYAKQVYITSFLSKTVTSSYYAGANSSDTTITLGQPKSITTDNLQSDTWQFPFTASNSNKSDLKVQGEVIFHLGKDTNVYNGYDYLMLSTVDASWQPNQNIWQQIVNSLKITEK